MKTTFKIKWIWKSSIVPPNYTFTSIKVDEEEDGIYFEIPLKNQNYLYLLEEICSEMEKEDWDYCTNLPMDQCTSNDTKVCKDCKWVQCNYATGNFSMCIPEDIEVSNKTNDICMTNIGFFFLLPVIKLNFLGRF